MHSNPTRARSHEEFMRRALQLAAAAAASGEVPVGAVLVADGRIIAEGYNLTRANGDPTAHAEVVAIQKAAAVQAYERFLNSTLYVTLEPCAMCAGAIVQARIPTVVYGALDPKAGACGSVVTVIPNPKLNHVPVVEGGVLEAEAVALLQSFFKSRR